MQRISRRNLIKMAMSLGIAAAAETIKVPRALASGGSNINNVQIGAIRWDPWYGSIFQPDMGRDLGLSQYSYRIPWFGKPLGNYYADINGNHQEIMDLECQIAAAAGINYWMFDWNAASLTSFLPDTTSGMMNGWLLYNNSTFKSLVKWCFMEGISGLGFNRFTNYVNQMIVYMSQSNYFTVRGGRPVMFIFVDVQPTSANGYPAGWATVAAGITALRAAAVTAGIGNPYVVIQEFTAAGAAADCASAGADCISSYTNFTWGNYAGLVSSTEALWTAYGATGTSFIPFAVMGGDTGPRIFRPPIFSTPLNPPQRGLSEVATPGTIAQRVQHAADAIAYVNNNPTQCPANAINIYSWTECDEGGGCLIPTLGDPPQSGMTTNILSALSQVFLPPTPSSCSGTIDLSTGCAQPMLGGL